MGIGHRSWLDIIFFVLVHLHRVITIFPSPVSKAQFIGEFWTNKQSATSNVTPTVLALYRIRYWRYAAPFADRRSGASSQRQ